MPKRPYRRSKTTSTDVINRLDEEGFQVSREWLGNLADGLFPGRITWSGGKRTYSPQQVAILVAATRLNRRLGISVDQLAAIASDDDQAVDQVEQLLERLAECVRMVGRAGSCSVAA